MSGSRTPEASRQASAKVWSSKGWPAAARAKSFSSSAAGAGAPSVWSRASASAGVVWNGYDAALAERGVSAGATVPKEATARRANSRQSGARRVMGGLRRRGAGPAREWPGDDELYHTVAQKRG